MKIAMVGTRGVPARYGGFETCVEEVGQRLVARGHDVVVYCRSSAGGPAEAATARPSSYLGMQLVHLPAPRRKSIETIAHSALAVAHIGRHRVDAALLFNAANAPLLPALRARAIPVATHVDGLEWQRAKWGRPGRAYYRRAETLAVRWSDALIADAPGIAAHYRVRHGVETDLIAYGASILTDKHSERLEELGLTPGGFHLVVARFEPENHVDLIVAGHARSTARLPLVVVGSAPYADAYTAHVHSLGRADTRFLGAVWDQELLDALYANAYTYQHGHSVGGTNPSLLRAIGAAAASDAFDVTFNREVLGSIGRYFRTSDDVARLIEAAERAPEVTARRAERACLRARDYSWDDVTDRYEALCQALPERRRTRGLVTGEPIRPSVAAVSAITSGPERVGYLPGAWDIFHIGHLNIVNRALQQCDRLVVGVVTDEAVEQMKGRPPLVPHAERIEIMRHVAGVAAAVADTASDKRIVWRQVHFDVVFKGSDWQGTPKGLRLEAEMASVGVEVVYLPYTAHRSSSQLRGRLVS